MTLSLTIFDLVVRGSRLRQFLTALLVAALSLGRVVPATGFSTLPTNSLEALSDYSDPYQANDIVTGFGVEARHAGFDHCLREVLVRISGEPRLEHDPRVLELTAHADAWVVGFDYADVFLRLGVLVPPATAPGRR